MLDMICWCPRFSEVLPLPCSPMPPPTRVARDAPRGSARQRLRSQRAGKHAAHLRARRIGLAAPAPLRTSQHRVSPRRSAT